MDLMTVQSLFQQGMFEIPNYQRGYAWEKEQIAEFIDDLEDTLKPKITEHYTGTVTVLRQKDENGKDRTRSIFPKEFKVFEVVDGQQRLTTFTMFIFAIHNRLKKLGIEAAALEDINKNIIYGGSPILQLNDDSDIFYKTYIISGGVDTLPKYASNLENKSQMNLANAKKQITKYLDGKKTLADIQKIYTCLMSKFKVNFYLLDDDFEVGVVFETMNNRGISLTQIDKVKNYLIFLCSRLQNSSLSKHINNSFGQVFKNLMKVSHTTRNEDEFLRYSYIVYTGVYKEYNIHGEVKNSLIPKTNPSPSKIEEYVNFLTHTSNVYSRIFSENFDNSSINILLEKIIYLGNIANFAPFLIAVFDKYFNKEYSDEELIEVLSLLEVFSFRVYKINNRRSDTGQNSFYKLAHELNHGLVSLKICIERIKLTLQAKGSDYDFENQLAANEFYIDQTPPEIVYFFYEYEVELHSNMKSQFEMLSFASFKEDKNKITVEHIDPQEPQNKKPAPYLHQLGNLTITYNNSLLSNKEFNNKKAIYKGSKLLVENELVGYEKWNRLAVESRTNDLIAFAKKRWAI